MDGESGRSNLWVQKWNQICNLTRHVCIFNFRKHINSYREEQRDGKRKKVMEREEDKPIT